MDKLMLKVQPFCCVYMSGVMAFAAVFAPVLLGTFARGLALRRIAYRLTQLQPRLMLTLRLAKEIVSPKRDGDVSAFPAVFVAMRWLAKISLELFRETSMIALVY